MFGIFSRCRYAPWCFSVLKYLPEGVDQPSPEVPAQTKSMCLQSFTMTEFFYRCSVDFPQVEIHSRRSKKDKTALRLCFGQAFNLDEAYEFLENLSLPGSRSDKGIFSQRPCKHTAYLACPRQDQKSNEDVHIQLFRENSWDWEIRGSSWNANPRTWRRMT